MAIWLGEKKPQNLLCTEELLFGLMNCRTNFLPSTDVRCALKIYLLPLQTHKYWKDTVLHKQGHDYLGNQKATFTFSHEHLNVRMIKMLKNAKT